MRSLTCGLVAAALLVALLSNCQPARANQPTSAKNQTPGEAAAAYHPAAGNERLAKSAADSKNIISDKMDSLKARIELERREVRDYLTAKNIFKSIVNLIVGSNAQKENTSRQILSVLGKVLNILKGTFNLKGRAAGRTIKDSAENVASAGVSILQGYVKSLNEDRQCIKQNLCQASQAAVRDGRELGYVVATVGSYAASYMLADNLQKGLSHQDLLEASLKGRQSSKELPDPCKVYACPAYDVQELPE